MRMMWLTILLGMAAQSSWAENLSKNDFQGAWKSTYLTVEGENQVLNISLSQASSLERHFESSPSQMLATESAQIVDDLLILTFNSINNNFGYKLVLSGWKVRDNKLLYGSMFMYRKGVQFNMLPVTYAPAD